MTRTFSLLFTLPLLLAGCSTTGSDCISSSESAKASPDFGSDAVAKAYSALPRYAIGTDGNETSRNIVERTSDAVNSYNMTPEVETLFVRRRLAANRVLKNRSAERPDLERLIALGALAPNEEPFLRKKLVSLQSGNESLDRDAQPLIRIPPRPSFAAINGNKSGHCVLIFDVSPEGQPENIQVGYCTDDVFERTSISSVSKWKYNPAIRDKKAVARTGVESKITYKIQDSCGNLLPE